MMMMMTAIDECCDDSSEQQNGHHNNNNSISNLSTGSSHSHDSSMLAAASLASQVPPQAIVEDPNTGCLQVRILSVYDLPSSSENDNDNAPKCVSIRVGSREAVKTTKVPERHTKSGNSFKFTKDDGSFEVTAPLEQLLNETVLFEIEYQDSSSSQTTIGAFYSLSKLKIQETTWLILPLDDIIEDGDTSSVAGSDDGRPTLRLHLTLWGPYRPEIALLLPVSEAWFAAIDGLETAGAGLVSDLPQLLAQPKYNLLLTVPTVVILPILLSLLATTGVVRAMTALLLCALVVYLSSSTIRPHIRQALAPTVNNFLTKPHGKSIVYQTGPRMSPVQLVRTVLPTSMSLKLLLSALIDLLGYYGSSSCWALTGESSTDWVWAPVQTILIMAMYENTSSALKYISFLEEALPYTDIFPTATLGWIMQYIVPLLDDRLSRRQLKLAETTSQLAKAEMQVEELREQLEEWSKNSVLKEDDASERLDVWLKAHSQIDEMNAEFEAVGKMAVALQANLEEWQLAIEELRRADSSSMDEKCDERVAVLTTGIADLLREVAEERVNRQQVAEGCYKELQTAGDGDSVKENGGDKSNKKKQMKAIMDSKPATSKKDSAVSLSASMDSLNGLRRESEALLDLVKGLSEAAAPMTPEADEDDGGDGDGENVTNDMLTDTLADARSKLSEELVGFEGLLNRLQQKLEKSKKEKDWIGRLLHAQVDSLKAELDISAEDINNLSRETGELRQAVKTLEREKYSLQRDNDRYKRDLETRIDSDVGANAQLEKLQKKYEEVMEENRMLREQAHIETSKLKRDYERKLAESDDEKRELMMKSSANHAAMRKANERVYEQDQELGDLKEQMTAMTLKLTRASLDRHLSDNRDARSSVSNDDQSVDSAHSELAPSVCSASLEKALVKKVEIESQLRTRLLSLKRNTDAAEAARQAADSPTSDEHSPP